MVLSSCESLYLDAAGEVRFRHLFAPRIWTQRGKMKGCGKVTNSSPRQGVRICAALPTASVQASSDFRKGGVQKSLHMDEQNLKLGVE